MLFATHHSMNDLMGFVVIFASLDFIFANFQA